MPGIRAASTRRMRRRVLAADLVVLNHALFFTLLRSQVEAEDARRAFFSRRTSSFSMRRTRSKMSPPATSGCEISQLGLRRSLQRLYNPRSKKGLFQAMKNGPAVQRGRRLDSKIRRLLQPHRGTLRVQAWPRLSCSGSWVLPTASELSAGPDPSGRTSEDRGGKGK